MGYPETIKLHVHVVGEMTIYKEERYAFYSSSEKVDFALDRERFSLFWDFVRDCAFFLARSVR